MSKGYCKGRKELARDQGRKAGSHGMWLWRGENCVRRLRGLLRRIYLPVLEKLATWVRSPGWEDLWRRRCQPTPALPRESHGQRSLVGCSLKSHKKLHMMEHTHTHTRPHAHTHTHTRCMKTWGWGDYGFGPSPGHTYKS